MAHSGTAKKWTPEEDKNLFNFVTSYLEKEEAVPWSIIAGQLQRPEKGCKKRWLFWLDPKLRQGPVDINEKLAIIKKFQQHGLRFSVWDVAIRSPYHIVPFLSTHLISKKANFPAYLLTKFKNGMSLNDWSEACAETSYETKIYSKCLEFIQFHRRKIQEERDEFH